MTCRRLSKDFIENYNEDGGEGCFLEVDVQYLEKLHARHKYLPFFLERVKI